MINKKKFLAIIPARSGSKGLKNKNFLKLGNLQLYEWTVKSVLKSKIIDHIIVSSDSKKITNLSYNNIAIERDHRKPSLAMDNTKIIEVILDILKKNISYDYVVLLQPTSPFRNYKDIDICIKKMILGKYSSAFSAKRLEHDPRWSFTMSKKNKLNPIIKNFPISTNRQDACTFYRPTGEIYIASSKWLINKKTFISNNSLGYLSTSQFIVDIDNKNDFQFAEYLVSSKKVSPS